MKEPIEPKEELPKDEKSVCERARGFIEHEDNLINHRFSWLVLAQSFLLAAWFTATSNDIVKAQVFSIPLGAISVCVTKERLLAVAGFFICVLPYISILAAVCSIEETRKSPEGQKCQGSFPGITSSIYRHRRGLVGAVVTPPVFIFVWAIIMWTAKCG